MEANKPLDFKNWIYTIDDKNLYKTLPPGRPVMPGNARRDAYINKWITSAHKMPGTNYKVYVQRKIVEYKGGKMGDPEGVFSNTRGYIHVSEI